MATHTYGPELEWTGDPGTGTSGMRAFSRDVTARGTGVPPLALSADRPFRGDPGRWNPELLLLAALSECHLLSFLHMAATHGVTVAAHEDSPVGTLEQAGVGGRFTRVVLHPRVTVLDPAHPPLLSDLHDQAADACFIANSVVFPVDREPSARAADAAPTPDDR